MADLKSIIPDASVLLKWLVKEDDQEQALRVRADFEKGLISLSVPSHCFAEICNMLGREWADHGPSFISNLLVSAIQEKRLTLDHIGVAFHIMEEYAHISFYDASYHALALVDGGVFLTADEKYYNKTKKEGRIMLLKDYGKKR